MAFSGTWGVSRCCKKPNEFLPYNSDKLYVFDITGYNYQQTPIWYDLTGKELTPVQLRSFPEMLLMRWMFYKDDPQCKSKAWFIKTMDDIFPTITETISNKRLDVRRIFSIGGETVWRAELRD